MFLTKTSKRISVERVEPHTLERNLMNVMFVIKDLHEQVAWYDIKEHTLERSLMNVMFVIKNLHVYPRW